MRISELSARSGLTVQTIKFYIREGLLPRGELAGATRAEYAQAHLERLRLIRALREVAELPVASIKEIMRAVDDDRITLHELFGTAQYALGPVITAPPPNEPAWAAARREVAELIDELGWRIDPQAPARDLLAQTFAALHGLGFEITQDMLRPYVDAAVSLARHETERLPDDIPRADAVRRMLVTTVLYERVLAALHRLAQEDASARLFSDDEG